eukprot:495328-Amphidinium_carterae.1
MPTASKFDMTDVPNPLQRDREWHGLDIKQHEVASTNSQPDQHHEVCWWHGIRVASRAKKSVPKESNTKEFSPKN